MLAVGDRELGTEVGCLAAEALVLVQEGLDPLAQRGLGAALRGGDPGRFVGTIAQLFDLASEIGLLVEPLP